MKKEHLLSSNIVSLSAIVGILKTCGEPVAVLQVSRFQQFPEKLLKICFRFHPAFSAGERIH